MFKAVVTHALENTQLGNSIKKGEYNDVVKKLQLFRAILSDFLALMHPGYFAPRETRVGFYP